jgi:hypothetical protein
MTAEANCSIPRWSDILVERLRSGRGSAISLRYSTRRLLKNSPLGHKHRLSVDKPKFVHQSIQRVKKNTYPWFGVKNSLSAGCVV